MKSLLCVVILTLLVLAAPAAVLAQDSGYIKVPNEDQEMNDARDKARGLLEHFWEKFTNPGPDDTGFAIKVALPYDRQQYRAHLDQGHRAQGRQDFRRHQ